MSSSKMDTNKLKPFIHLPQGHGRIYTFPGTVDDTQTYAIGTTGCVVCVCVYIPLEKSRALAAHIDATISQKKQLLDDGTTNAAIWQPTSVAQGEALKTCLKSRLEDCFAGEKTALDAFRRNKDDCQKGAIVIWPWQDIHGVKATDSYIAEALVEFFGLESQIVNATRAHGFIVDVKTGEKHFLGWKDGVQATDEEWNTGTGKSFDFVMPKDVGYEGFEDTAERMWSLCFNKGMWFFFKFVDGEAVHND